MARWWDTQFGTAAQFGYQDPGTAVQASMVPNGALPPQQQPASPAGAPLTAQGLGISEQDFKKYVHKNDDGTWTINTNLNGTIKKSGFMGWVSGALSDVGFLASKADKDVSGVPVLGQAWKGQKWVMDKLIKQPLDLTASGAYWLYSNVASRPITTAVLQADKALAGHVGDAFSPSEIGQSYKEAKHISPGQAIVAGGATQGFNPLETAATVFTGGLAYGPLGLWHESQGSQADQAAAAAHMDTDKYLYDTNFWKKKDGWKYNVGTGLLDATVGLAADPTVAGGKALKAVRGATRAVEVAEGASKGLRVAGVNIVRPRTAEELVNTDKFENFHAGLVGKSPEEIRLALERGRASRYSAFRSTDMSAQLADVLSKTDDIEDWRLATRFAMGDADAFALMSSKNTDFALSYAKALDHRVNIADADRIYREVYDSAMTNGFAGKPLRPAFPRTPSGGLLGPIEGKLGRPAEAGEAHEQTGRKVADRVTVDGQGSLFNKSAYYSPNLTEEEASAADKTFEQLAIDGRPYQWHIKPFDPAQIPTNYYNGLKVPGLQEWNAGVRDQLEAESRQLTDMTNKNAWLRSAMTFGTEAAENPLFGSMQEARFAGVGRNVVKQAERRAVQYYGLQNTEGFQSRLLQNGVYGAAVRMIGKLGDRLPSNVINHNMADSTEKLASYLKASPIDKDQIPDLITNYSRIGDKSQSVDYIDNVVLPMVFEGFGKKYNIDLETTQRLYNQFRTGSASELEAAKTAPSKQQFSAALDQDGVRVDKLSDGERTVTSPILGTQLQYSSALPPLGALDDFLVQHGSNIGKMRRAGIAAKDVVTQLADAYNHIFKLGNLLSVKYVARNLTEERLAMAAKFGTMQMFMDSARGGGAFIANRTPVGAVFDAAGKKVRTFQINKAITPVQSIKDNIQEHINYLNNEIKSAPTFGRADEIPALQDRLENAQNHLKEFQSYEDELLSHATRQARALGEGTYVYRGKVVSEPFNPDYAGTIPREQITSDDSYKTIFSRGQSFIKEDMMRTGNHVTLTPNDANHMDAWKKAVNNQILQDRLAKLVLQDDTGRLAYKFLRSPEGAVYRANLGIAGRLDAQDHIGRVKAMVDQYIPEAMREEAKAGRVSAKSFSDIKVENRPLVHGEELRTALRGDKSTFAILDRLNDKFFQGLPRVASDRLTWQPTYVRGHRIAMQRQLDLHFNTQAKLGKPVDHVTNEQMNSFMKVADKEARQFMREVLYHPNRTNLSAQLRYISPFFSAYTDSIARWGGLVLEDPSLVGKMAKIYNAPAAIHLVTDQSGDTVDENGRNSKGEFVDQSNRVFNFQASPLTKNLPKVISNAKIGVGSLNVVTPGDPWWSPGFGPVVSIPADTVMRNYPESSQFLSWLSPYGTQATSTGGDVLNSLTPAWFDDLRTTWDPNGQKYQDSVFAAYRSQLIDYHNGEGPVPDWKKAEKDARNLYFLSALADSVLPGKVRGTDKYQFYVDAYKALQQQDASTARDQFMARYGKDFKEFSDAALFTSSATKSGNGVPSTVEGVMQDRALGDLIKQNPELGGFIVGDTAQAGAFNQWALLNQKATGQRVTLSAEDRVKAAEVSTGWDAYVKISAAINAEMNNRGLTSLRQKGGEDLVQLKNAYIYGIAEKYPAWADDFTISDRDAIPKRIDAFRTIVNDPRLALDPNRSDVRMMRAYIGYRDQFTRELAARKAAGGSNDITAQSNRDLNQGWQQLRTAMAEQNTKFESIMNRYLANDDLQLSSIGQNIGR